MAELRRHEPFGRPDELTARRRARSEIGLLAQVHAPARLLAEGDPRAPAVWEAAREITARHGRRQRLLAPNAVLNAVNELLTVLDEFGVPSECRRHPLHARESGPRGN